MKPIRTFVLCFLVLSLIQCASSKQSNLEKASFALDKGNYNDAIEAAEAVLTSDPNNAVAARILGSAYMGRGGFDFLDLAEVIIDLDGNSTSNFSAIAAALPEDGDLDDLRLAITSIEALDGADTTDITNEDLADAVFDLGIMQIIEHFAVGVYSANFYTNLDASEIAEAAAETAQNDLIDFDNRIIGSGVSNDQAFIAEIRQTYCILESISASEGFTLAEYQALVACQLDDDPDTVDTTAFTADIANCAALNPGDQTAAIQACYDENTAL